MKSKNTSKFEHIHYSDVTELYHVDYSPRAGFQTLAEAVTYRDAHPTTTPRQKGK